MSLHLVYIGAAAELVPAASLRALAGGGAVYLPEDLEPELADLLAAEAPEAAGTLGQGMRGYAVALERAVSEPVTVAIAGPAGTVLARDLSRAAAERGIEVTTTPHSDCLRRCPRRAGARLVAAHHRHPA